MKNKALWILLAAVILGICGFLFFRNKPGRDDYVNPNDSGILELGLKDEKEKEESSGKDAEKPSEETNTESGGSQDTQTTETTVPEGGEAVDNGDGSVNIVMNDDEETFGE